MDDFRNIDFTNYLIVFDGNILGISVAPGELMADGDLKKYADCRTPEYAAWINLKQAKMICRIKFAGMDKFSLPFFSENNTINIPEHAFNAIEHMAELLLLPMAAAVFRLPWRCRIGIFPIILPMMETVHIGVWISSYLPPVMVVYWKKHPHGTRCRIKEQFCGTNQQLSFTMFSIPVLLFRQDINGEVREQ